MDTPETKRFGRYEVVAELGRGAMGVVYKARDPQIDRLVAVKTISLSGQEPDEEKEFRLRFAHEAQAAGRLHHPGIVAIFDVGESPDTGDPYIVLEHVAGESLNRILAREKKLTLDRALQLAAEIADALDYAHAQNVIHRDIKPGNILISSDGHAKIADFGIAKLNLAHFTVPGRVLGTPAYMAPEQLNGEGVDGRADLFSLGVILYAMVTGHSPFQGDSATTVCFKVANREPVAASALDLSLPRELDEVIGCAMAKDREQRYQSGADFAGDVRQLLEMYKPSTTASLRVGTRTGTRSTTSRTRPVPVIAAASPADGVAHTTHVIHNVIRKISVRDMILAGATIAMLGVVLVKSNVFVASPKPTTTASEAAPTTVVPAQAAAVPATPVRTVPVAAAPARKKTRTATPPHPNQPVVVPLSTLDLAVQHQFKDATLFVWVDDKLVLTSALHGAPQKHLVVFNGLKGVESETLKIPAGKHTLRVRAVSADETIDLSRSTSAEFVGGADKSLQVIIDKHNTVMRLNWQ